MIGSGEVERLEEDILTIEIYRDAMLVADVGRSCALSKGYR